VKQKSDNKALVSVIMGSKSDWDTMKECCEILKQLKIPFENKIISAHRTPNRLFNYSKKVKKQGIKVIIAGAGGSAHLPGMVASLTTVPVLGVPIQSKALNGLDSLLSIVQMPPGIPVGTLAIGSSGAKNASFLAASILSLNNIKISKALDKWRLNQTKNVDLSPVDD
jgi:5-(carboxyamino)imidazole ribonucleotide mutase